MQHWRLLPILLALAACGEKQEALRAEQLPAVEQTMAHTAGVAVQAGGDANVTVNNYQKSQDYQDLLAKRDDARENVQKYPDDAKFRQVRATAEQNLESFKRDVLKLAEAINKFPINTERLKQAVALFNAQKYAEARKVLDAGGITQEQDALLAKQQRLQEEQASITAQLDDKANEWLLKAQLTAIDYSLGDQRIAQTSGYFDKTLKLGRTPERLFTYATFLQENRQYHEAEILYTEALTSYRPLAKSNPAVYLPALATTLNNLGGLAVADSQRRKEAETLYIEALDIRRALAKDNSAVYLADVASTLHNLGNLVASDNQRRKEAEKLYTEALDISRKLAKDNPVVYLPYVAIMLNDLGESATADSQRHKEAETIFSEALEIRRTLAKENPAVYLSSVVITLNNLGSLVAADSQRQSEAEKFVAEALSITRTLAKENPAAYQIFLVITLNNLGSLVAADSQRQSEAEKLFIEALEISRTRAKNAPTVYPTNVAQTLAAFGNAYLDWNEPDQALPLLQESAQLFAPLAKQAPSVFGGKYDYVLKLIEQAKAAKR